MDPYLGPEYPASRSRRALTNAGLAFRELSDEELYRAVAQKVAAGQVVGWCQGRMELGPRALGNRSILGDPRNPAMKEIINEKVKQREPFRPYAPAVLEENASEYFHLTQSSPFMLLAPRVREEKKAAIPAVTHVDGTARVQTVSRSLTPRFWSLIHAFADLTGLPMVINTSMNLRGEPIVCSPEDAVSTFQRSRMDALVLGNLVVERGAS
jgi:carbamoyltransferase